MINDKHVYWVWNPDQGATRDDARPIKTWSDHEQAAQDYAAAALAVDPEAYRPYEDGVTLCVESPDGETHLVKVRAQMAWSWHTETVAEGAST